MTLSFGYNRRWRLLLPCALAQAVGQLFGASIYPVTSNAGELALLLGLTNAVFLIQQELVLAGTFATYLHKSNLAFSESADKSEAKGPETATPPKPRSIMEMIFSSVSFESPAPGRKNSIYSANDVNNIPMMNNDLIRSPETPLARESEI